MIGRASFDRTRAYRYALTRRWSPGARSACFCLLNPSTADARRNDPTVRRCIGYAMDWGFDALEVVNIFAFRSTDPGALAQHPDPVGPRNDRAILRAVQRAELVILGWGAHGRLLDRGGGVLRLIADHCRPHCFGITATGQPRHPLYLARAAHPQPLSDEILAEAMVCK
ncbi:MAG: DUF1643 domain-containing protein [Leptolyngbya sp. PLA3]|nr:MAG: DUF1643 domain-containing protein [Cyanobacteria bacterium CYA]MCE7969795.1 DUF1643 domain-containing protein [Leptolyngbya sp. PL-A3]